MAKDNGKKDRKVDDLSSSGIFGGLKARRKAMESGNPGKAGDAFKSGLADKSKGSDGTNGRKEND